MPLAARLHYAASESDADLLYLTRFHAPDAFLWWKVGRTTHAAFNALEIGRARKTAKVDQIWSVEELLGKPSKKKTAKKSAKGESSEGVCLIQAVSRKMKVRSWEVPWQFPAGLSEALRAAGIRVTPTDAAFCPERLIKSPAEVRALLRAQQIAEAGMARAFAVLRASTIGKDKRLRWGGGVLTSERLRGEIDAAVIREGGLPSGTIVAGGRQACDPHERGHGPLRAHELIILDIFPRDQKTGYFGDLSRTVVRGRASEAQRRLYKTVANGQKWILENLRAGADGKKLHDALVERFAKASYPTERRGNQWVGFFHGTGHGVGLEIHETPRFRAGKFRSGMVVTVEPGLYYPNLGGVRIEDLVAIRANGITNLTRVPRVLEL